MNIKLIFNLFLGVCLSICLCAGLELKAQAFGTPGVQTKVEATQPGNPLTFKPFSNTFTYGYLEYLGKDYTAQQAQNLIIFFHGRGEAGGTLASLEQTQGYPGLLRQLATNSMLAEKLKNTIVISPLRRSQGWWSAAEVKAMIDGAVAHYNVNPNKVYVVGFSAGAAGIEKYINGSIAGNYPIVPAAFYFGGHAGAAIDAQYSSLMQDRGFFFYLGQNDASRFKNSRASLVNLSGVSNGLPSVAGNGPNVTMLSYWLAGNAWSAAQEALVTGSASGVLAIQPGKGHIAGNDVLKDATFLDWLFSFERSVTFNPAPIANAGADQTITLPTSQVNLDGSGSVDDQGIETYTWQFISGPTTPTIVNAQQVQTLVTNLTVPGEYQIELRVTDAGGKQNSDTVVITVESAQTNMPPVANAGANQVIVTPQTQATLDGSGSTDDAGITSYQWRYLGQDQPVYVNFTNNATNGLASAPWNNFVDFPGTQSTQMSNLVDANNQPTSIAVQFVEPWQVHPLNPNPNGTQNGIYPNEVMRYFYFFERETGDTRTIKVSGLSPSKTYTFTLFNGANFADNLDKFITRFSVNGVSQELDPERNTDQTAVLENLVPNAQGELNIEISVVSSEVRAAASISALVITTQSTVNVVNPNQAITQVTGLPLGKHDFQLTVTDAEGLQSQDVVTVEVVEPSNVNALVTTQINFTLPDVLPAGNQWNETSGSLQAGYQLTNLTDANGQPQTFTMELVDAWTGRKKGGKLVTNAPGLFPNEVREGVYFFERNATNNTRQIKFSGLNANTTYTFTFLSSRTGSGDKTTIFSANGIIDSVDANNNTEHLAKLSDLTPNAQGEIIINVALGVNAQFAYLNGIIIEAQPNGQASRKTKNVVVKELVRVYPNPTSRVLNYQNLSEVKAIYIRDLQGRLVQQINTPSSKRLVLNDLPNGLYLVEFVTPQGKQQIRLQVKK